MIRPSLTIALLFPSLCLANPGAMLQAMLRTPQTACFSLQSSWTPQWANLQSYWTLDGSGTLSVGGTVSSTSVGPNGTMTGAASTYSAARIGTGLSFNGSSNYVTFGSSFTALDTTNFTVAAWIKPAAYPSVAGGILDKSFETDAVNYGGWGLWLGADMHLWTWLQGTKDLKDTATIPLNTWTFVAVTFNNTAKSAKYYVNGVFSSTQTDATIVSKASGSTAMNIGVARTQTALAFNGMIDNVATWNLELSAAEIARIYEHQRCQ